MFLCYFLFVAAKNLYKDNSDVQHTKGSLWAVEGQATFHFNHQFESRINQEP